MWTITARLNICGYEISEVDLTPVLGFAMIALVVVSLAANTFN